MTSQPNDPSGAERHYDRGLFELDRYLFHFDEAALPRAVDAFRLATTLGPDNAITWTALGFALDAADAAAEALVALRRAHEVDPQDEEVEVFVLTLFSESGPEREAMAAVEDLAVRKGVDLDALRRDLSEAGMPVDSHTLLLNGFLRARNFVRSRLEDSIEHSRRTRDPQQWAREIESERQRCGELQEEMLSEFDSDRVPVGLRDVTHWAVRVGVGDDVCRSMLLEGLTTNERSELEGEVQEHATAIHAWLDEFEGEPMTTEAASFMNLLLALEETDSTAS